MPRSRRSAPAALAPLLVLLLHWLPSCAAPPSPRALLALDGGAAGAAADDASAAGAFATRAMFRRDPGALVAAMRAQRGIAAAADRTCVAPLPLTLEYDFYSDVMGKRTFDLGNYDVCRNASDLAKYCLMNAAGFLFGICIPSACVPPHDVNNETTGIMEMLLSQIEFLLLLDAADATYHCGDNAVAPGPGTWASVGALVALACLALIGTAAHRLSRLRAWCLGGGGSSLDALVGAAAAAGDSSGSGGGSGSGSGAVGGSDDGVTEAVRGFSPRSVSGFGGGLSVKRQIMQQPLPVLMLPEMGSASGRRPFGRGGRRREPEYLGGIGVAAGDHGDLMHDDGEPAYGRGRALGASLLGQLSPGQTSQAHGALHHSASASAMVGSGPASLNGGGSGKLGSGGGVSGVGSAGVGSAARQQLLRYANDGVAEGWGAAEDLDAAPPPPRVLAWCLPLDLLELAACFSLAKNWGQLMRGRGGRGGARGRDSHVAVLAGVRFLSAVWIVLGHTLQFMLEAPGIQNWFAVAAPSGLFATGAFQVFAAASFASDSFFVLSGVCATATLLSLVELYHAEQLGLQAGNGVAGGGAGAAAAASALPLPMLRGTRLAVLGGGGLGVAQRPAHLSLAVLFVYVLKRALRLWPLLGASLACYLFVLPSLSAGPFWWVLQPYTAACQNGWWTPLAFVNDVVPFDTTADAPACMPWTWQVAADSQLHLAVPLVVFVYLRHPSLGVATAVLMLVVAVVAGEEIVSVLNLSAVIDFGISLSQPPPTPAQRSYYNNFFVRPWTRAPAYLIGVLLALLLDRLAASRSRFAIAERLRHDMNVSSLNPLGIQTFAGLHMRDGGEGLVGGGVGSSAGGGVGRGGRGDGNDSTISSSSGALQRPPHSWPRSMQWLLVGAVLAVFAACIYGSTGAYASVPTAWPAALVVSYTLIARPAWAIALALLLFLCLAQSEAGGPVGWLLSWRCWQPLARLSFALYLVHPMWCQLIFYEQALLLRFSPLMLAGYAVANTAVSLAIALVLHLLVEAPAANLVAFAAARLSDPARRFAERLGFFVRLARRSLLCLLLPCAAPPSSSSGASGPAAAWARGLFRTDGSGDSRDQRDSFGSLRETGGLAASLIGGEQR